MTLCKKYHPHVGTAGPEFLLRSKVIPGFEILLGMTLLRRSTTTFDLFWIILTLVVYIKKTQESACSKR